MKKKKINYVRCEDLSIIERLKPQDIILYKKKFNKGLVFEEWISYSIQYDPVFFKHSFNWTIRAVNQKVNKENSLLSEYLYINDKTLCDFKLDESLVREHVMAKQIKNLSKYKIV